MPPAPARPRFHRRLAALITLLLAVLPVAAGTPASHLATQAVPGAPVPARSQGDGGARRSTEHDTGGGAADDGPRQAEEWFVQQRAYPLAAIPSGARAHALTQLAALRRSRPVSAAAFGAAALLSGSTLATNGTWSPVGSASHLTGGPTAFTTDYGAVGGRVTSLAIAPTAPYTVYAGTAGGGVWTSPDGGVTWTPRTDGQSSLAIGALAIAPTAPYTAYALTGEGNFSADSYYGAGLLESANGGGAWTMTGAALSKLTASRLAVDPITPSILYAAMGPGMDGQTSTIGRAGPGGLYRSSDGGMTWTPVLQAGTGAAPGCTDPSADVPATDVAVATTGVTTTIYAALGDNNPGIAGPGCAANGVYRSTDQGATWTRLAGFDTVAISGRSLLGRIAVATMPGNPNVVYAAAESIADGTLQGLYESTDGGATWQALARPSDGGASQYWYDLYVTVDPTSASTVYLGGIDIFKSTNAGATWTNLTRSYSGGRVHPDQHALAFAPGEVIDIGNDGGAYSSATAGATWTDRSSGLGAIQLYGATVSAPGQGMIAYAGAQDNDVAQDAGTGTWTSVLGGDGGYSAIDPTNVNTVYSEVQGGWLYKTVTGGASWTQLTGTGATNDPAGDGSMAFITPFALDQSTPQRLLMGTYRLWESDNGGSTWSLSGSGQNLTGGDASAYISALALAPSASASTTYVGTSNGHVQASADGNVSWTDGSGIPNRYVTSIAVDPADARTAWAGLSGFGAATPSRPGHVFQTTDGGQTWRDVSGALPGGLPDVPVNALAVDGSGSVLFAGADVGVFVSTDDGATWSPLGSGLPTVPVFQLQLRSDGTLYAATHGRGLWSISTGVTSSPITPTPSATPTRIPAYVYPATATSTATNTPSPTPTNTPLPASTATPTSTQTPSPSSTASATPTQTVSPPTTATATASLSATATGMPQGRVTPARVASTPAPTGTVTAHHTTLRVTPTPRCTPTTAAMHVDALMAVDRRTRLHLVVIAGDGQGRARGTLRFADPRAPLALSAVALTSLRVTSHGATVTGWQRSAHGRTQVTLIVTGGHTARADLRAGRYHRTGTLSGTLRLQPATACHCTPAPLSVQVQATLPTGRHSRATLLADMTNDAAGHLHGRLRWSDPAAHLTVDTTALTVARASGQSIVITAWQRTWKRRESVTLTVAGGHAPHMDLRLGRYHRAGALTGTARVALPTPC